MSATRELILKAVYEQMKVVGYQGMRPDKAIRELGITKGAMYHYFPNKLSIGYAIVDEIIFPSYTVHWLPLRNFEQDPVAYIEKGIQQMQMQLTLEDVNTGSPLNNLIQEMSPIDEGFRKRLHRIMDNMFQSISMGLENGIKCGFVSRETDTGLVSNFILSCIQGGYSLAKVRQDPFVFKQSLDGLKVFLQTIRK